MVSSSSSAKHKYEGSASLSPHCSWKMISVASELWKSSKSLGSRPVGGVNSAKGQDSSIGGGAVVICLGVVHMEEEVQERVQVEVESEEQSEGETHGKEQSEEQRRRRTNAQPLIMDDRGYGMMRTNTFLSHCVTHHETRGGCT